MKGEKKKGKGFAITSLVLGILGIALSIILVGGILGILGTIFGVLSMIKSKGKNKMGIVATVLYIISISIMVFFINLIFADTTPPTIEQQKYIFYIGDNISAKDLVSVSDIDGMGNKTTENIKIDIENIDTTTKGL